MSDQSTTQPNVRRQLAILIIFALIASAALVYFKRDALGDTWDALVNAKLRFVILLPILQVLNYYFIGKYYQGLFRSFGARISTLRAWGVVSAMNFVNQILPSGGVSGITYLAYGFRNSLDIGKTTLVQLGRYVFAFISYTILAPIAVVIIIQTGNFTDFESVVQRTLNNQGYLITLVLFAGIIVAILMSVLSQSLSRKFNRFVERVVNTVRRLFGKRKKIKLEFIHKLSDEFHDGVDFIRKRGISSVSSASFMFLSVLVEISIVYVSLLAVGYSVNIGVVFVAFIAANVVGVVSVIPGDIGVHEAAVILVLQAFDVPDGAAISATLLYRVFNKLIFLPIGFYFYQRILQPATQHAAN